MEIEDIVIGDVYYVPYKGDTTVVLKGYIIEISQKHKTVLLKGISPYTEGNFGARIDELYDNEYDAYKELVG